MPTVTKYSYVLPADVPQGVAVGNLTSEINAPGSGIVVQVDHIDATAATLDIYMKDVLPSAEKTALDGDTTGPAGGLLAAHDPAVVNDPVPVDAVPHGPVGPLGENRIYNPPNRPGFYRNDRDFLLYTAKKDNSFIDRKQNIATVKQDPWEELTFVGVYKDVAGTYTLCADDAEALSDGIVSVWDFHAHDHSDPDPANCAKIDVDMLGGVVYPDPNLVNITPTEDHVMYAVAVPNIPAAFDGQIPFFDAFLERALRSNGRVDSINPKAVFLSPELSDEATRIRFFFHYPKGGPILKHYLQIVMYRPLKTW